MVQLILAYCYSSKDPRKSTFRSTLVQMESDRRYNQCDNHIIHCYCSLFIVLILPIQIEDCYREKFRYKYCIISEIILLLLLSRERRIVIMEYRCDRCDKNFKWKVSLTRHQRRKIPCRKATFFCNDCAKAFVSQESLGKHKSLYCKYKPVAVKKEEVNMFHDDAVL